MTFDEQVARYFGDADAKEQAELINAVAGGLLLACNRDLSREEIQLCNAAEYLDVHGQRFVTKLADFVRLRSEQGSVATGAAA